MPKFPLHLLQPIENEMTVMVVSGEQACMARPGACFIPEHGAESLAKIIAVDIPPLWQKLEKHSEGRAYFTKREIASASGVSTASVDVWVIRGIVSPEIDPKNGRRAFSFLDLFAATLAGSLRRAKVPMPTVELACRFIRYGQQVEAVAR